MICKVGPEVNYKNEEGNWQTSTSRLYLDLVKEVGNRDIALILHSLLVQPEKIQEAQSQGFELTIQGEMPIDAARELLNMEFWRTEGDKKSIQNLEKQYETWNYVSNTYKDFDNVADAMALAERINSENEKFISWVEPYNGKFNVLVEKRSVLNQEHKIDLQKSMEALKILQSVFDNDSNSNEGSFILKTLIDAGWTHQVLHNPSRIIETFTKVQEAVRNNDFSTLNIVDLNLLVALNMDATQIPKLKTIQNDAIFDKSAEGEIGEISSMLYNYFQGDLDIQPGEDATIQGFMEAASKFRGVDMQDTQKMMENKDIEINNSLEARAIATASEVQRKKHIVKEQLDITMDSTNSALSTFESQKKVIANAIEVMQTQINVLKNKDDYYAKVNRFKSLMADFKRNYKSYDHLEEYTGIFEDIDKILSESNNEDRIAELPDLMDKLQDLFTDSDYEQGVAEFISEAKMQLQNLSKTSYTEAIAKLSRDLSEMTKMLEDKQYCEGMLKALENTSQNLTSLLKFYGNGTDANESNLFTIFRDCGSFKQFRNALDAYKRMVDAMVNIESLRSDTARDYESMMIVKDAAIKAQGLVKSLSDSISTMMHNNVAALLKQTLGAKSDAEIANLLKMAEQDVSIWDRWFNGIDSQHNPLASCVGKLIRNAQQKRDQKMSELNNRIVAVQKKFEAKKVGDTSFMFEDVLTLTNEDGTSYHATRHIISEHDWNAFYRARNSFKKHLAENNIVGWKAELRIKEWEEKNMVPKIVDSTIGRIEMVPSDAYKFDDEHNPLLKLNDAQREFYDEMLKLKGELDSYLPPRYQSLYKPAQVHKDGIDMVRDSKGMDKPKTVLGILHDAIRMSSRDKNEGFNKDTLSGDEHKVEASDEHKNRRAGTYSGEKYRDITVMYSGKLQDQSLLNTDFSKGLLLWGQQCLNYEAMSGVMDAVEQVQYYANQMPNYDNSESVNMNATAVVFKRLVDLCQHKNVGELINGFIDSHMYQVHLKGWGSNTKWTKAVKTLIRYTSFKSLSTNVFGATANAIGGKLNLIIEAGGGEFFGIKDMLKADMQLFKNFKDKPAQISDFIMGTKTAMINLKWDRFNVGESTFDRTGRIDFKQGWAKRILDEGTFYLGYATGDQLVRSMIMESVLNHQKVTYIDENGRTKHGCLNDIFYSEKEGEGNAKLLYREAYYTGEDGMQHRVDELYLDKIRGIINHCEKSCLGAMGRDSQGEIQRYLWGQAIMNLRSWMVRSWQRRMGSAHYDADLGYEVEGSYVSALHFLKTAWQELEGFNIIGASRNAYGTLTSHQQHNLKRCAMELSVLSSLFALSFIFDEEDYKGDAWARFWCYQMHRQIMELSSNIPILNIYTVPDLLNSPIPAVNTWNNLVYPIAGILNGDILDTYKSGVNVGKNKYVTKLPKAVLPYKPIENLMDIGTSSNMFYLYNK